MPASSRLLGKLNCGLESFRRASNEQSAGVSGRNDESDGGAADEVDGGNGASGRADDRGAERAVLLMWSGWGIILY